MNGMLAAINFALGLVSVIQTLWIARSFGTFLLWGFWLTIAAQLGLLTLFFTVYFCF